MTQRECSISLRTRCADQVKARRNCARAVNDRRIRPVAGERPEQPRSEVGEPESDLAGGRLRRVRAVHEVLLPPSAPSRGPGRRGSEPGCSLGRVGGAAQQPEALDAALPLEDRRRHGPRGHELHQRLGTACPRARRSAGPAGPGGRCAAPGDQAVALRLDPAEHLSGGAAAVRRRARRGPGCARWGWSARSRIRLPGVRWVGARSVSTTLVAAQSSSRARWRRRSGAGSRRTARHSEATSSSR